jgi:hypothetical protein
MWSVGLEMSWRRGACSQAHLTYWFSGNIGRSFFFAFHLVTWHWTGGQSEKNHRAVFEQPLLIQGASTTPQAQLPLPLCPCSTTYPHIS